jgi:hypothetical protein
MVNKQNKLPSFISKFINTQKKYLQKIDKGIDFQLHWSISARHIISATIGLDLGC